MTVSCRQATRRSFAAKMSVVGAVAATLSACAVIDLKAPEDSSVIIEPQQVETLGETIAREQHGEHGCLVAGNLNKGGECKKLREIFLPPKSSSDPKSRSSEKPSSFRSREL